MTDDRPRPQYGEYATPEEQARALGVPYQPAPQQPAPQPAAPPQPGSQQPGPHQASAHQPDPPDVADRVAPSFERPRPSGPGRTWDTYFTVALLILGFLSTLTGIVQNRSFGAQLDMLFGDLDIGSYTNVALANTIGLWLTISQIALFLVTVIVSVLVLRKHRRAFYIPLVGAVLYFIVALILVYIALTGDPAFSHYIDTMKGPAN